jgi:hypothetical protein
MLAEFNQSTLDMGATKDGFLISQNLLIRLTIHA